MFYCLPLNLLILYVVFMCALMHRYNLAICSAVISSNSWGSLTKSTILKIIFCFCFSCLFNNFFICFALFIFFFISFCFVFAPCGLVLVWGGYLFGLVPFRAFWGLFRALWCIIKIKQKEQTSASCFYCLLFAPLLLQVATRCRCGLMP